MKLMILRIFNYMFKKVLQVKLKGLFVIFKDNIANAYK